MNVSDLIYDTVIFDLDGTLLDTLEDLADADNYVLEKAGLPVLPLEQIREYVGNGVRNLMMKSVYGPEFTRRYTDVARLPEEDIIYSKFGTRYITAPDGTHFILPVSEEKFEAILKEFRAYYSAHSMVKTRAYDGVRELLRELQERNCAVAVVSNKFDEAVRDLCRHFFPEITITIGMQQRLHKKPAPDMVMKAFALLGSRCTRPVYVGDSEVDIATAANSGVDCISCLWGFREEAFLKQKGAVCLVRSPLEILDIVENGMDAYR